MNEVEYELALKRIEEIWDAPDNTPESLELELLIAKVQAYEAIYYSLDEK